MIGTLIGRSFNCLRVHIFFLFFCCFLPCLFGDSEPCARLLLRLSSVSSALPEIGGRTLDSLCRCPFTGLEQRLTELVLISGSLQTLSSSVVLLRTVFSGLCLAPQQLDSVIFAAEGRRTGSSCSCFS